MKMKKNLFLMLTIGVVIMLVACGNEGNEHSPMLTSYEATDDEASASDDEASAGDDGATTSDQEQLGIGDRECLAIRVEGDISMEMQEFFDFHSEIMDDYFGDLDAFLNARIDHYTGLFYAGSGEYVILVADDLENWQTPDLLADVNFTICRAEHSYDALSAIRTQIDNNHASTSARITSWGIDTLENNVFVYLADLTDEAILDFKENVSDSPLIEFIEEEGVVFQATILEIHDQPQVGWYYDDMTVLVTSAEHGRMAFDHRRLEDIGATVGDVVELTITEVWVQPDPAPVYPDSWRLID